MARAVKWKNRTIQQIRVPKSFVELVEEVAKLLDHDNTIQSLTINISDRTYNNSEDNQIVHLKYNIETKRELVSLTPADINPEENEAIDIWVNPEQMLVNAMLSPWLRKQEIIKRLNRAIPADNVNLDDWDDLDKPYASVGSPVDELAPIEDEDSDATEAPFTDEMPDPVALEPLDAINEQFEADGIFYRPLPITLPVVEPQTVAAEPFVVIYQGTELLPTPYQLPSISPIIQAIEVAEVVSDTQQESEVGSHATINDCPEVAEILPIAAESPVPLEAETFAESPTFGAIEVAESIAPTEQIGLTAFAEVEPEAPVKTIQPGPLEDAIEPEAVATQEEMVVTEPIMQIAADLIQQAQQLHEDEKLHQFGCQLYQTWKVIAEQQSTVPWNVPVALETIYRQAFSSMLGHNFVYQIGHIIKDGKHSDIIPVLIPGANNLDINQQKVEFITYRDTSMVTPAPSFLASLAVEIAMEAEQESHAFTYPNQEPGELDRLRAERQQHLASVRSNSQNHSGNSKHGSANAKTGWKRLLPW